jgi:predicted  nucleic acid-binding Zn-ribbon protein
MSLAGKIFAVITLVAAVFYAGITAALMSLQENWRQKCSEEETKHKRTKDEAERDKASLTKTINEKTGLLAIRNDQNRLLRGQVENLQTEWQTAAAMNKLAMAVIEDQEDKLAVQNTLIARYNDDLGVARGDIDKKKTEIDDLNKKLVEMTRDRDGVRDQLVRCQNELTNWTKEAQKLTGYLAESNDQLQTLKDRYPDIAAEIRAPGQKGGIQSPKVIRGKVTGVDKNLGLVIINVGQRHEVLKGYAFIVFRSDEYIGKVVVDEVFPDMSATHYIRELMKKDVEVGDDVTTKLSIDL